jgi:hypothetical protein
MTAMFDPLDQLDASLQDFEPSLGSPRGLGHSGFRSDDTASELNESEMDMEVSAGGYSPPAWRRLGNGDRSSGFWRKSDDLTLDAAGFGGFNAGGHRNWRGSSYETESDDDDDEVLAQAMRTRLPTGSVSPDKERSPEPEYPARMVPCDPDQQIKSEMADEDMKSTITAPREPGENCKEPHSFLRLIHHER